MESITIDADNAEEVLKAAAEANAEIDGTPTPTEESTDPTPAEPAKAADEGESEVTPDPAKVEGLEIEAKGEGDGEDTPSDSEPTFDIQEVFAEYAESGEIAQETNDKLVEALESAGFKGQGQAIIDQYMSGAQASVAVVRNQAFEVVGGEQEYASVVGWAAENLPPADIEAFNKAVADPAMVSLAVRGLHAQYQAANGGGDVAAPQASAPPARVAGGANAQAGLAPVTSNAQVAALTGDPRWDSDPGWQAQQLQRIQASIEQGHLVD